MRIKPSNFFSCLLIVYATSTAYADNKWSELTLEDELNYLIELSYIQAFPSQRRLSNRISPDLSCTTVSGGHIGTYRAKLVGSGILKCKNRNVLTINTVEFANDDIIVRKIRDALLLPTDVHIADGVTKKLEGVNEEFCEIDGRNITYPINYVFLVRSDVVSQKDYDEPYPIEYAWFLNSHKLKIEVIDASRVTCYRVDI